MDTDVEEGGTEWYGSLERDWNRAQLIDHGQQGAGFDVIVIRERNQPVRMEHVLDLFSLELVSLARRKRRSPVRSRKIEASAGARKITPFLVPNRAAEHGYVSRIRRYESETLTRMQSVAVKRNPCAEPAG